MEDVADVSIRKARENLSKWEDLNNPIAPIETNVRETIIELMSVANSRNFSPKICDLKTSYGLVLTQTEKDDKITSSSSDVTLLDDLKSSVQFLTWFQDHEDKIVEENISHGDVMHDYVSQISKHQSECTTLLNQLDTALNHLNSLHNQYTSVSTRTTALHTDCEHLLAEQNKLSNTADSIQSKLWYFMQVESVTQKLTSPAFSVTSDSFIPLLSKIDQCIAYMKNNPNYKESSVYLVRYMHCLSRALGLIRVYVTRSLENATKQVLPKPGENQPNSDNATVLYYSKFRTNAPRIKSLMSEIEDRLIDVKSSVDSTNDALGSSVHNVNYKNDRSLSTLYNKSNTTDEISHLQEYQNLLQDCHQCYFQQRQMLLGPCVTDAVSQLLSNYRKDHCSLVRSGCAFLVHVCEDEHNLYNQFFSLPTHLLDSFLEGLCTSLYDGLRPLIIHIDHLETLSELCGILRRGMIEEHLQNNPRQLNALRSVVTRMLEDAQERLVYRAHVYINSDIAGFVACSGDLAYPSKLELMEQIAREIAANRRQSVRHHTRDDASSVVSMTSESVYSTTGTERFSRVGSSPADLHGMWYPTLRRTLMCLSKLYRCVDKAIFQGVSLEAIAACIDSLNTAAQSINSTASHTHGALFQIKHLLILREQLAPFQVESSLKETSLDWSRLKDAAYDLVQQRGNFFSFSSNNAVLQFIVDGIPNVTEQLMDSKKDVDNELKRVCEKLIHNTSEGLVGQLTTFLSKIEVIITMNDREKNDVKPIMLQNQPFATADKINELILAVNRNIRSKLPKLQRYLRLYLANRDTEYILLKPIRISVANSFARLSKILTTHYSAEDALVANCPTVDEVNMMINAILEAQEKKMSEINLNGSNQPDASYNSVLSVNGSKEQHVVPSSTDESNIESDNSGSSATPNNSQPSSSNETVE